ncbi:MAG TPA: Sec-independent protein translocase subunit TatA [Pedococcus sp.]|jgi:sec-independent protein translocase protein TatA|nr:Sec-independent protein translocase subunit TatA [Pedococcus sp.]
MFGGRLGTGEILIIVALLILIFGWKRLPDAARSLGRSMRIFKSEVSEMKQDGKSAASGDTVRGEAVHDQTRPDQTRPDEVRREDPIRDRQAPPREGDALREDHSPRSDNPTGPVS